MVWSASSREHSGGRPRLHIYALVIRLQTPASAAMGARRADSVSRNWAFCERRLVPQRRRLTETESAIRCTASYLLMAIWRDCFGRLAQPEAVGLAVSPVRSSPMAGPDRASPGCARQPPRPRDCQRSVPRAHLRTGRLRARGAALPLMMRFAMRSTKGPG